MAWPFVVRAAANRYMAFECLITFPSRERFFFRPGSVPAKTLNSQLTSTAPGWFGYGRPLEWLPTEREVETAPNSYAGSGGLDLAGQDGGDHVSGRVPETSPCRTTSLQNGKLDLLAE